MIFERIKSAGLAHNSYLIGSEGEAAVIDPRRDCDVYSRVCVHLLKHHPHHPEATLCSMPVSISPSPASGETTIPELR